MEVFIRKMYSMRRFGGAESQYTLAIKQLAFRFFNGSEKHNFIYHLFDA